MTLDLSIMEGSRRFRLQRRRPIQALDALSIESEHRRQDPQKEIRCQNPLSGKLKAIVPITGRRFCPAID
jgi:hypothetical protein